MREAMFRPQATPYSASLSSYGVESSGGYPGLLPVSSAGVGKIVYSGGPTLFEDPVFPPSAALNFDHPPQHHQLRRNDNMSEHDFRAQEVAAQEYERENRYLGPMVGEKKSSHAITEEYAKADPIYVAKTIALPQKFSHYRPIAGDGNCGWRAAGFSYFECLIRSQSRLQVEEEIARITSLNNMLTTIGGIEQWLVEDMTEESMTLLKELADLVEESTADATRLLLERFNDAAISLSIIYHLRLLASAWLAANPDEYVGFIPDGLGVLGYRKNCLEVVNTEIEHLGMTLLIDVLIKPIGITVEIVMLDRSDGSQANSHIFQSEDSNGVPTSACGPMIHLLYRPSHYDILYKDTLPIQNHQIKAEMSQYSNVQVNRAHSLPQLHHHNNALDMARFSSIDMNNSPLLDIPGYSLHLMSQSQNYTPQYHSLDSSYTASPMSTSISPVLPSNTHEPAPANTLSSPYMQQHQNTLAIRQNHNIQPYSGAASSLPTHNPRIQSTSPHPHNLKASPMMHRHSLATSHSPPIKQEVAVPISTPNSFRPSHYQYAANANERHEPVICQTTTFKNSHFNTAHYLNPDFQPEEWTPESEERRGSS